MTVTPEDRFEVQTPEDHLEVVADEPEVDTPEDSAEPIETRSAEPATSPATMDDHAGGAP